MIHIEIDDKSGFCFGVVKAITTAEELLAARGGVYSLGDIVHNRVEVSRLEGLGMKSIGHGDLSGIPSGSCVLVRAHGEPPATYALARSRSIEIVDATCPVVAHLQDTVRDASARMAQCSGQVVILGKPGHAEIIGLEGQCTQQAAIIIESLADLDNIDFDRPIYLLSQTTQSLELFKQISAEIIARAADPSAVTVHDTICRQVSNRNPHLDTFARRFDVIIFVSGRKSSNGKALYAVCLKANTRSHQIEDETELRPEWFDGITSVGVCGATSTPKWLMERVAASIAVITERAK